MQVQSSAQAVVSTATKDEVLGPLAAVARRVGIDPMAARLFELREWLADDLQSLEEAIASFCPTPTPASVSPAETSVQKLPGVRASGAVEHLLSLKGKRIRPLCVLLAARLGGRGLDEQVRSLAVACELVHAATLLHDDVIDNSAERRGAPTARVLFGNSASILAGDYLLVEALRLVESAGFSGLMQRLLDSVGEMVRAEALQLERRGRFEPDRETYLEVIRGKTASLFRWGLVAGGTAGGLDEQTQRVLARVGTTLGMAFQLADDLLDLEGDAVLTGKDALVDLREGKLTWPQILAAERDPELRQEFATMAADSACEMDAARARAVVSRMRKTGALAETRSFAVEVAERACAVLAALPEGPARVALEVVVKSAVHRVK